MHCVKISLRVPWGTINKDNSHVSATGTAHIDKRPQDRRQPGLWQRRPGGLSPNLLKTLHCQSVLSKSSRSAPPCRGRSEWHPRAPKAWEAGVGKISNYFRVGQGRGLCSSSAIGQFIIVKALHPVKVGPGICMLFQIGMHSVYMPFLALTMRSSRSSG